MTGLTVQQEWTTDLAIQQQSVLLMACRGPDGMRKSHPAKALIRAYRGCVLNAASTGVPLEVGRGDSYMETALLQDSVGWRNAVLGYLFDVDEIPLHYHLHLLHGAEILGYKYPNTAIAVRWLDFYYQGVDDMHLYQESEAQMDARLNDFGRLS